MARTALDLISASLKRLNVISGIETPAADLAKDALERLNDLLETWTTEELTVYAEVALGGPTVPITTAHPWVAIGPGGNLDVDVRPPVIEHVSWLSGAAPGPGPWSYQNEYPLTPLLEQDWLTWIPRNQTAIQPTHYYYNPGWPLGLLYLGPVPQTTPLHIWVWILQPLSHVDTLTTPIDLPPGYFRALRDNLAIELAPELGRVVDPALQFAATDALAQLKRTNFRPRVLELPLALQCRHGYDWRVDD